MIALRELFTRHRVSSLLIAVAAVVIAAVALAATLSRHGEASPPSAQQRTDDRSADAGRSARPEAAPPAERLSAADRDALEATVARLRSMPGTTPATSAAHRPIRGSATRQPDLYAAAFTRELLTQDYATPRAALLAWVQSESASSSEPTVVGLIPANLRGKLAVASVQEGFNGPGPVPSRGVWDALATEHGRTSVVIQRIIEPVAWSAAVANGTITDPGVTAREVDAKVTLHSHRHGRRQTTRYSVALTMNLEGPPVRDRYGLVTLVRYKSVQAPTS